MGTQMENAWHAAQQAFQIEADALAGMAGAISEESFRRAVTALARAPRIAASGCGHSGIACRHFAHLMCCIERPARFLSPSEALHGGMGFLQKGDAMLLASRGGRTGELIPMLDICRKKGVWLHTDAVQAAGNIPLDVQAMQVDMLSLSAHKFNGPKGCGALYIRRGVLPVNFMEGGGQENRRRAGTENIAGIVGLGRALEIAVRDMDKRAAHEKQLRDYVVERVLRNIPGTHLNGDAEKRLPGNANISFPGLEGETILLDLDMHGICASTGSACNSDSLDPSHVLLSIGLAHEEAHGTMRFSFGPQNTMEEAERLCEVLEEVIPRRRAMSPVWNTLKK